MPNVYEIVTEQMVERLEAGTVPWRQPWNDSTAPRNMDGRKYRGINVFLLALSAQCGGYQSPYWLTFRQAKARDGSVRKGEKSTLIVFWKQLTVTDKETGKPKTIPLLRYYRVFNLEQTDGVKLPKAVAEHVTVTASEPEARESAERIVAGYPDGPSVSEDGHAAFYRPGVDAITVPPRATFAEPDEFYATLFHEMTHSTGHVSRLDRFTGKNARFGSHDYGREELVAEMGAAFLNAHAGITVTMPNSAAYLASWVRTLKADTKAVVVAAGQAQRAAEHVLGAVAELPDAVTAAAAA